MWNILLVNHTICFFKVDQIWIVDIIMYLFGVIRPLLSTSIRFGMFIPKQALMMPPQISLLKQTKLKQPTRIHNNPTKQRTKWIQCTQTNGAENCICYILGFYRHHGRKLQGLPTYWFVFTNIFLPIFLSLLYGGIFSSWLVGLASLMTPYLPNDMLPSASEWEGISTILFSGVRPSLSYLSGILRFLATKSEYFWGKKLNTK